MVRSGEKLVALLGESQMCAEARDEGKARHPGLAESRPLSPVL